MSTSTTRVAFLIVLGVLLVAFGYMVLPFFAPAFFALILAIIFNPLQRFLQDKFKGRRYLAATVTTIVVCVVILVPLAIVLTIVMTQLIEFAQALLTQLQSGRLAQAIDQAGEQVKLWIGRVTGTVPIDYSVKDALETILKNTSSVLYKYSPRMLTSTLHLIIQTVLMVVFMFGFFAEGSKLYDLVMELSPLSAAHKSIFAREIRGMIAAALAGMFMTGIIQGTLIGVGFSVAGISQAVMWGLVAVITSFIPIIGAALIYVGAFLILLVLGENTTAVCILLYGLIIISSIDNVVKPIVMRGMVRVHPILLLVSLLGGIQLFGPVGLIFGPVLLAVFLAAIRIYKREFLPEAV